MIHFKCILCSCFTNLKYIFHMFDILFIDSQFFFNTHSWIKIYSTSRGWSQTPAANNLLNNCWYFTKKDFVYVLTTRARYKMFSTFKTFKSFLFCQKSSNLHLRKGLNFVFWRFFKLQSFQKPSLLSEDVFE